MDEATKAAIESGKPVMVFNIGSVGQMNPSATTVTNNYYGDQFVPKDKEAQEAGGEDPAGEDEDDTSDPDDDFELPTGWESYPNIVFTNFKGAVETSIKEAGATCINGAHFACLMAVCDDHSSLRDRSDRVNFSRAMLALRLYKPNKGETCEKAAARLANNMSRYINAIQVPYKKIPQTTPTLKKLHEKCASLGIYFDSHYVRYRFKD